MGMNFSSGILKFGKHFRIICSFHLDFNTSAFQPVLSAFIQKELWTLDWEPLEVDQLIILIATTLVQFQLQAITSADFLRHTPEGKSVGFVQCPPRPDSRFHRTLYTLLTLLTPLCLITTTETIELLIMTITMAISKISAVNIPEVAPILAPKLKYSFVWYVWLCLRLPPILLVILHTNAGIIIRNIKSFFKNDSQW